MDVIELQITNALQGLPLLDLDDSVSDRTHNGSESQPTSPKTISSTIGSVRRSKRTPHTRDSTQTTFSVDTHNTNRTTMSVIGQLTDGSLRRGGSILDIDQISTADRMLNKSGSISERVALIQAKVGCDTKDTSWQQLTVPQLELALAPVTSSADTTSEGTAGVSSADTSSDAIPNVKETPPSRTVSPEPRTTVAVIAPSDDGSAGEDGDPSGTDADDHHYRHGHHHSHHHHHGHSHGHHSPHHHHSAPPVSIVKPRPHAHRAVVLRPPPRRVTQRKSYESVDLTPSSAPNTPRTHAKTGSLTPREIILTPVESPDSPIRRPRDSQHHTNVDDRPASVISTTAFGI
jgi:hypothetical protein